MVAGARPSSCPQQGIEHKAISNAQRFLRSATGSVQKLGAEPCMAYPCGIGHNRVEYRLQVPAQGTDYMENFAERRPLLQRLVALSYRSRSFSACTHLI